MKFIASVFSSPLTTNSFATLTIANKQRTDHQPPVLFLPLPFQLEEIRRP